MWAQDYLIRLLEFCHARSPFTGSLSLARSLARSLSFCGRAWNVNVRLNVDTYAYKHMHTQGPIVHMSRTLTSKMLHKTNLQVFLWFSEYSRRYVVILIISAPICMCVLFIYIFANEHISTPLSRLPFHVLPDWWKHLLTTQCVYGFSFLILAFALNALSPHSLSLPLWHFFNSLLHVTFHVFILDAHTKDDRIFRLRTFSFFSPLFTVLYEF